MGGGNDYDFFHPSFLVLAKTHLHACAMGYVFLACASLLRELNAFATTKLLQARFLLLRAPCRVSYNNKVLGLRKIGVHRKKLHFPLLITTY